MEKIKCCYCKYWNKKGGHCLSDKFLVVLCEDEKENFSDDTVLISNYDDFYSGDYKVGPNFGCIHFIKREYITCECKECKSWSQLTYSNRGDVMKGEVGLCKEKRSGYNSRYTYIKHVCDFWE